MGSVTRGALAPEQPRQPALDAREVHRDQRHVPEVPRQQRFAQHHRTEQDGADGDQERDQQQGR